VSGFGVVVNPHAGGRRRGSRHTRRLVDIVGGDGWVYETATVAELDDVAREFHRRGIDVLAVCGGDGSFFPCLSACIRCYDAEPLPAFLPLRAGTVNTIARAIGGPKARPEAVLRRAVQRYRCGAAPSLRSWPLLCTNRTHHGFMTGAGTIVSFLEAYYQSPLPGTFAAARLMLRLVTSALNGGGFANQLFRWVDAGITCDGQAVPFAQFSAIYASTIKDIGLGFRPTYRGGEQLDTFHFLAGPLTVRETARCLPRIRRGVATDSPLLYDRLARKAVIEFRSPTPYMMDGDLLAPVSTLTIEAGAVLRVVIEGGQS
jgi:hypothetical protein